MRIRVHDIVKAFDKSAALDGVTLEIASGELVALLGPSGSGKTTLLRVIAGLEIPTAGEVYFGEENASLKPVQERRVGFVFQHYALFRHLTVFENIAFGLRVRDRASRPAEPDIRRKVLELLELVQLPELEKRYPNQLSGGQRQRVALARALAVDPKVLLLDEPFGALDAKVRKDLRRWLRDLHRRTGHTTIFVTHDQDEALELADRVALLNAGRIEQAGTPEEIYDQPASPFVFSFIGESHCVPVVLRGGVAFLGEMPLAIPANGGGDGDAALYLRPQDVMLAQNEAGAVTGELLALRRSGATRRAELRLAGSDNAIEIEAPAAFPFRPGDQVPVRIVRGRIFPRA